MKTGEFRDLLADRDLFGEDLSAFADDAEVHYRRIMEADRSEWYRFVGER